MTNAKTGRRQPENINIMGLEMSIGLINKPMTRMEVSYITEVYNTVQVQSQGLNTIKLNLIRNSMSANNIITTRLY